MDPRGGGASEPYGRIADDVGLRATEIQERVQYVLCTRVLRHAMRQHPQAWAEAASVLGTKQSLAKALARLFGKDTPPSVAAMVLETLVQESEEHDESPDVVIGRELRKREAERNQLGFPACVWVVRIVGRNRMTVAVEGRDKLRDTTVGLVRVLDAR